MKDIYKSASKIVFITMAATACAGFIMKILPVDDFMILAVAIFGFYTAQKGETGKEYAGK